MRYLLRRALRVVRYYIGWRAIIVLLAFVFALLAIVTDSGAPWYLGAAALLALVLIGTIGTRVNETHRQVQRISKQLSAGPNDTAGSAKPEKTAPAKPQQPAPAQSDDSGTSPEPPAVFPEHPDVAVIVAAFNETEYIVDCLESVRSQTWRNFECIVVDDESTDNTLELAFNRFSSDPRFRFVSIRRNAGLSAARNVGIEAARAEWVTFLDGDDYLYRESLERRLAELAPHMANNWVAGTYCSWAPVPQNEPLRAQGEERPAKKRIAWLDALHDAPFIASAPIVRADIVRAMGGFRDVDAAEDADMWTKVLRHGYVFLPTKYTGIAYRQKANSMFRRETVEHATVTVGLYKSNYERKPDTDFVPGTPFHYTDPAPTYVLTAESFRRNLIALTTAVAQDDESAVERFSGLLDVTGHPYLPWVVDIDQIVRQAAHRSEMHTSEGMRTRIDMLVARTMSALSPVLETSRMLSVPSKLEPKEPVLTPDWAPLKDRRLIHLPASELASAVEGHVVMTPSAAYHVDELGPLARELDRLGIPVAFMVTDRRWDWTEAGLRSWDFPVYAFPEDTGWTASLAGIVTLNDWGEEPHQAIVAANEHGVATFAKVEGVQDFDDIDVPRIRNPYQTAHHVLCQGRNDAAALADRADTHIVGNSRLEAIWRKPGRRPITELVVVNLNFTWGVLEEARAMWVDTVIAAIKQLGCRAVFSLHPAEKARPEGVEISEMPMRHLLTQAGVLVSRFSTIPFEAMARGVPFIYHNPHNEAVPTFANPRGAYEITQTADELAAAIELSRTWAGGYRDQSEHFFRDQIDIQPGTLSEVRAAAAIAEKIRKA